MNEEYEFHDSDGDSIVSFRFDIENYIITETLTILGNSQPQLDGACIINTYIFRYPGAVEEILCEFESLDAEFRSIDVFEEVDGILTSYDFDGTLKSDKIQKFRNLLKKHAHDMDQTVDV
ncbi:MAG: hypothetical protein QCH31_12080 [Methanolobus sp.]|nr:hypothetical protein [Methanolobus sp.]